WRPLRRRVAVRFSEATERLNNEQAPDNADRRSRCSIGAMNSVVLHFGSRSGSWFALGLFAAMFGQVGWEVAREIRLRARTHSGVARFLGLALFVGPVVMVYASSLSGFYEAQIDGQVLRLHYLFPWAVTEIAIADVVTARPIAAIRGR